MYLGCFRLEDEGAREAILEALEDDRDRVCLREAWARGEIGPKAVPPLIEALKDDDATVRECSALALGMIGPEAKEAVPALLDIRASKDENWTVRVLSALALGWIDAPSKRASGPLSPWAVIRDALRDMV